MIVVTCPGVPRLRDGQRTATATSNASHPKFNRANLISQEKLRANSNKPRRGLPEQRVVG